MITGETQLTMVHRHVREGVGHILRQPNLILRLEASRSSLQEKAQAFLAQLNSFQNSHRMHLAQIEAEILSGRREAGGNVLPLRS